MSGDKDDVRISTAATEASRWLTRLERESHNPCDFDKWLREHPSHAREFLEMTWLDVELGLLGRGGTPEAATLIRQVRAPATDYLRRSNEPIPPHIARVRKDSPIAETTSPPDTAAPLQDPTAAVTGVAGPSLG
jgi:hypothetical protein